MTRIDTNYIVRYLINDNIEMADIAEDILTNKSVFISNEVLAEVVYVLLGVYGVSKAQIADQLSQLIDFDNVTTLDDELVKRSLEIFKTKNLDFIDCLLCAYSRQDEILTFDKKLNSCIKQAQS
jgi:predicted nucleic-acid-binding protein